MKCSTIYTSSPAVLSSLRNPCDFQHLSIDWHYLCKQRHLFKEDVVPRELAWDKEILRIQYLHVGHPLSLSPSFLQVFPVAFAAVALPFRVAVEPAAISALEIGLVDPQSRRLRRIHSDRSERRREEPSLMFDSG